MPTKTVNPNSNVPVLKEGFGLAARPFTKTASASTKETSTGAKQPAGISPLAASQLLAVLQKVPENKRESLLRSVMGTGGLGMAKMKKGGLAKKPTKVRASVKVKPRKK